MKTAEELEEQAAACFEHNMELRDRPAKRRAERRLHTYAPPTDVGPGREMIRNMKRTAGVSNHKLLHRGNPHRVSLLYSVNRPMIFVERVKEKMKRKRQRAGS